jgi:L-histidine N-alpha-methyltransferase
MIVTDVAPLAAHQLAQEVRDGLLRKGQKELPSSYLYDALGSTLFEAITYLPEYGLTRADERLMARYAAEIAGAAGTRPLVIELGSGSGRKTRHILEAASTSDRIRYIPIDVSITALSACEAELRPYADVVPMPASYLEGLKEAVRYRESGQRVLLLFLGSTIGNFERPKAAEFLRAVRACLQPGDGLLLGADLIKPVDRMLLAYDDPTGVTAAFNRNLLGRVNRELGANFDLTQFAHEARYETRERRIEMHLRSRRPQRVSIPGAGIEVLFETGETIWTESSHKFEVADLNFMARASGFDPARSWVDEEWPFVEALWLASSNERRSRIL